MRRATSVVRVTRWIGDPCLPESHHFLRWEWRDLHTLEQDELPDATLRTAQSDFLAGQRSELRRKTIRPFAEWRIIRDVRRRSSRGRYTTNAATSNRRDIRTAIDFLNWLDEKQLDLAAAGREDLDL